MNNDPRHVALEVQNTLKSFGVDVVIQGVIVGPSVVRINLSKPTQIKERTSSQITAAAVDLLKTKGLPVNSNTIAVVANTRVPRIRAIDIPVDNVIRRARDIAIRLNVPRVRIDHDARGLFIEVPRAQRDLITGAHVFSSTAWRDAHVMQLPLCLGVDLYGDVITTDLAMSPHVLVAGTTGSGKSHTLHAIIASLVKAKSADDLRLHLVDLKGGVELSFWNNASHMHDTEAVYDIGACLALLTMLKKEINGRYAEMRRRKMRTFLEFRDIESVPYIVIVIDEIATLMLSHKAQALEVLVSLSQTARSAGVHFVICTQRPSADIISGSITANYPLRIAHAVSTAVNSRVIGVNGAETLLGKGDALINLPNRGEVIRAQVPYINTEYIKEMIDESCN